MNGGENDKSPVAANVSSRPIPVLDSANHFEVIAEPDTVILFRLRSVFGTIAITRLEALNLAAWLSIIADPSGEELPRLIDQIKKS